jgi:hypothetical protein
MPSGYFELSAGYLSGLFRLWLLMTISVETLLPYGFFFLRDSSPNSSGRENLYRLKVS